MKTTIYEKNLKVLRRRFPNLFNVIDCEFPKICDYRVESAKNGSKNLVIEHQGKTYYVHSKYDPEKEGFQLLKSKNFRNPKLMMVLGFGFGYHVRAILKELEKINLFVVIVERDFNSFRFALQNIDLTDLLESHKLIWLIGVPEEEQYVISTKAIQTAGVVLQLFLKTLVVFEQPVLGKIHGEYHEKFLRAFREAANQTILNYGNCPADSMMGVENLMQNLSVIIKNPGVQDLKDIFKGVPGILVSTGPSLDKNIKDLVGVENRCVMFCADSALSVLLKAGITPHAFTSLERVIETVKTYENIPEDQMKKVWMAATPVIRPEGYRVWKGPTFITYRDFAHFHWIDIPKGTLAIGPSCSNMAFKILEYLGCDPIILVGQDCAFESVTKTHAAGAHDNLIPGGVDPKSLIKVKGNYTDFVLTDMFFEMFRKCFVTDVANFKGRVINCTAGGAYIEGTELMPLAEAIKKYCVKEVDAFNKIKQNLKYPSADEADKIWKRLKKTIVETISETKDVVAYCEKGVEKVEAFEKELAEGGYTKIEDFLARYPEDRLDVIYNDFVKMRSSLITMGKYFNLYLMHIVQMVIVRFEMDLNELPSLCDDFKRCKLQAIRVMKRWFPTIRDICVLSLKLLENAFVDLEKEFEKKSA